MSLADFARLPLVGGELLAGEQREQAQRCSPLIVSMSLQPAIPRRVALQQSSPPLHQLYAMMHEHLC